VEPPFLGEANDTDAPRESRANLGQAGCHLGAPSAILGYVVQAVAFRYPLLALSSEGVEKLAGANKPISVIFACDVARDFTVAVNTFMKHADPRQGVCLPYPRLLGGRHGKEFLNSSDIDANRRADDKVVALGCTPSWGPSVEKVVAPTRFAPTTAASHQRFPAMMKSTNVDLAAKDSHKRTCAPSGVHRP